MGQAKLRGTKEQRIAQALERQAIEDAASRERFREAEKARIVRLNRESELRKAAKEEGRPVLVVGDHGSSRHTRSMLMVALTAASLGAMVISGDDYIDGRKR